MPKYLLKTRTQNEDKLSLLNFLLKWSYFYIFKILYIQIMQYLWKQLYANTCIKICKITAKQYKAIYSMFQNVFQE